MTDEKFDLLEDDLIALKTNETAQILRATSRLYNEMVDRKLFMSRRSTQTNEILERGVTGYIGTLSQWKKRAEELRSELCDPPKGGVPGAVIRLLLCVSVPLALWLLPPVRAFLCQPAVFFFFNLFVLLGIPAVFLWAVLTGKGFNLLMLLMPVALFIGLFLYQRNYLEKLDRLPFTELAVIFTVFYVMLFLLRFHLIDNLQYIFSPQGRQLRALCRMARKRTDAILLRLKVAINCPYENYKSMFVRPDTKEAVNFQEDFRFVFKYYETLRYSFG